MNKELIARLKDPKQAQPYWMRTEEEKEVLKAAAPKGLLHTFKGIWPIWRNSALDGQEMEGDTYILKPDYQPELEYEECPVYVGTNPLLRRLLVKTPSLVERYFEALVHHVNFAGFFCDGVQISLDDVATNVRKGRKVVARLVRE